MKRVFSVITLAVFVVLIGCTYLQSAQEVPRISKEELKGKLGSPDLLIIDVRTVSDWDNSTEKIAGAKRMEPDKVDSWADTLPKDKEIVLYCA